MIGSLAYRLETSASARSTNVTFGDNTSSSSAGGGGPFAKGSDGCFVGQAYGGYRGFPDVTLTGGRMPNPFVTTRLVWDDDINPEGLAEQWKHTLKLVFGESASPPSSYSKDGNAIAPPPSREPFLKLDLFVNFGQFVYDDANPEIQLAPAPQTHSRSQAGKISLSRIPMPSCWGGRQERGLSSRASCIFSLRRRSTTTPATVTRLTSISQATPVAIKPVSTVFWSSTSLPRSAGKLGKFPRASLGILQRTSKPTIGALVDPQAIPGRAATVTRMKSGLALVS